MMREELSTTALKDFEANMTSTIHGLQEELREERAAREKLEEHIQKLETTEGCEERGIRLTNRKL